MRLEALGPLRVATEGADVSMRPAQRRLLASLLIEPDSAASGDVLIDRMWNGAPPPTARNTLHVHLSGLRRRLPGLVCSTADGYRLALGDHSFDVFEFATAADETRRRLHEGRPARAISAGRMALDLWRGVPYPELDDLDAARGERTRLERLRTVTREGLGQALIAHGDLSEATMLLEALVAEEPLHEPFWEQLVQAWFLAGRRVDALRSLREARRVLGEELGVEPGPRLRDLEERVLVSDPEPRPSTDGPHHARLPVPDTSFVGREDDCATLERLLEHHRLVTVTGGPGVGKTRLALETGARIAARFPGGVSLVRLVECAGDADVTATIAAAVGSTDQDEDPAGLWTTTARRPGLLILDNCEHVLAAITRFVAADGVWGRLRVLATSRTPLGIPGERVHRLRPLPLTADDGRTDAAPAMRLLLDRVAAVDPSFPVAESSAALGTLCRRTDGIPLALELAARWVPTLDPDDVPHMAVAAADRPVGDPRHDASVGEAIDRSVALLEPAERSAFAAASVFVGRFSADSFHRVAAGTSDRVRAVSILARLVDSSLLATERCEHGILWYRMLAPVREHARLLLQAAGDLGSVEERHGAWFTEQASIVAQAARGPDEAASFGRLDQEISDYRAAMRLLLDRGRASGAATIAVALTRYWFARYLGWEARRWLDEALDGDLAGDDRLRALAAAGWCGYLTASYDEAEESYRRCLDLARAADARRWEAEALYGLARIHSPRGELDGRPLFSEALTVFEEVGAAAAAAECRLWLGLRAAERGNTAAARRWLQKAIPELEEAGYSMLVSVGRRYLSLASWYEQNEDLARRHLDIAEDVALGTHDQRAVGGVLIQRALVEGTWGDPADAARAMLEALAPIPPRNDIDFCLVFVGAFPALIACDRWSMAARLLDHIDRTYHRYGWMPLEDRFRAATRFRSAVLRGLETSGACYDETATTSAAIADELRATLVEIAVGAPATPRGSGSPRTA